MHMYCAVVGLAFKLLPAVWAGSLWAGVMFVYYMLTIWGEPEHTGERGDRVEVWLGGAPGSSGLGNGAADWQLWWGW